MKRLLQLYNMTEMDHPDYVYYSHVLYGCVIYYTTLLVINLYMRDKPAFEIKSWVFIHNAFLSAGSLALLIGIIYELWRLNQTYSLADIYCPHPTLFGSDGHLYFYYFFNYLFKYLELLDTVQLALKKKEMTLLHTYHHGATVLLTAVMIKTRASVQFIHIALNLTVHVLMYGYYATSTVSKGFNPWWKSHLTTMQIIQFVIGLVCAIHAISWRLNLGLCHGEVGAAYMAMVILSSYLLLFIRFYLHTYVLAKRPGKAGGNKQRED